LSDTGKRREYNLIYPSINLRHANPQDTKTRRPPPASASRSEADNDVAQIAALRKEKEERGTQWRVKRNVFESSIFEMQRTIRRLEQDIKGLATIIAAEKAQKASENSWGTWLLSPLTNKVEESEDMKAHNARKSQERKIEQDLKERRLISQKTKHARNVSTICDHGTSVTRRGRIEEKLRDREAQALMLLTGSTDCNRQRSNVASSRRGAWYVESCVTSSQHIEDVYVPISVSSKMCYSFAFGPHKWRVSWRSRSPPDEHGTEGRILSSTT
jgi:hypothetical protein